jgi:hypothetical protein
MLMRAITSSWRIRLWLVASHIDMFDRPQYVTPAVAKLKEFFDKAPR